MRRGEKGQQGSPHNFPLSLRFISDLGQRGERSVSFQSGDDLFLCEGSWTRQLVFALSLC